jgi:hypothetical protein
MPVTRKQAAKKAISRKATVKKIPEVTEVDEELADLDPVEVTTVGSVTVIYDIEKETPGTQRFKERERGEGELPVTGVLYMKKTAFRELGEPVVITVVITPGEVAA